MYEIPLIAEPSQSLDIVLNQQNCTITLLTRNDRLFCSLEVDGTPVFTNNICHNMVPLKDSGYLPFTGNLTFYDRSGVDADPSYEGLSDRFKLLYIEPDEEGEPLQPTEIVQ